MVPLGNTHSSHRNRSRPMQRVVEHRAHHSGGDQEIVSLTLPCFSVIIFVLSVCTEYQLYLFFPAQSMTYEDNANDPDPNMLEAQDRNISDAQQTYKPDAGEVKDHSNKHNASRKHPAQCNKGKSPRIEIHDRLSKQGRTPDLKSVV